MTPEDGICPEIGLPVGGADGVPGEEGDAGSFQVRSDPVVAGMAGLDVVVACHHGVIFHVRCHPGVDVRRHRVHIIEIVGGVVALEYVSGIDQYDVLLSDGPADAVHDILHCIKRSLHAVPDVGGVEVGAMDVVGGEHLE